MRAFLPALALCVGLLSARAGAAPPPDTPRLPPEWALRSLPGADAGVVLIALERKAVALPARYRVVVVPGSGCTGWSPVADRYFAGLLHAELLVLHKPGVNINAGLALDCSPDFVHQDRLSRWRDHAQAALHEYFERTVLMRSTGPVLPVLLVGISEGAELLPSLAENIPALAGVVLMSAPGLDPRESGALQAQRQGHGPAWQALEVLQASKENDALWAEGRSLGYWRDLWNWPLSEPLLKASWPLLRVWGDADALIPITAYQHFSQRAKARRAPFCDLPLSGADHGLQSASTAPFDGVRWLWAKLESWARHPVNNLCAGVRPTDHD